MYRWLLSRFPRLDGWTDVSFAFLSCPTYIPSSRAMVFRVVRASYVRCDVILWHGVSSSYFPFHVSNDPFLRVVFVASRLDVSTRPPSCHHDLFSRPPRVRRSTLVTTWTMDGFGFWIRSFHLACVNNRGSSCQPLLSSRYTTPCATRPSTCGSIPAASAASASRTTTVAALA